jgi:hypothetical protein
MLQGFLCAGNATAVDSYNAVCAEAQSNHVFIMAADSGKTEHCSDAFLLQVNGGLICNLSYISRSRAGEYHGLGERTRFICHGSFLLC